MSLLPALRILAVVVAQGCASLLHAQLLLPPPPRAESFLQFGGAGIDGTLHLGFDLGALDLGSASISFRLVHRVMVDSGLNASSTWDVPELSAFLVPAGRREVRVKLFGAGEMRFRAEEIDYTYRAVGPPGVLVRRLDADRYSIRMSNGWHWFFVHGLVASAHAPDGTELTFQAQGGRVKEMLAERDGQLVARLSAHYSDSGVLISLAFAGISHTFIYRRDGDALVSWQATGVGGTHRTMFSYSGALLSGIGTEGHPVEPYGWEDVPGAKQFRNQWPLPVRLKRSPKHFFRYLLTQKGYRMDAQSNVNGQSQAIQWNPALGEILLSDGGKWTRQVRYGVQPGRPEFRSVTSILERGGELLRYDYSAGGRLNRSWREASDQSGDGRK